MGTSLLVPLLPGISSLFSVVGEVACSLSCSSVLLPKQDPNEYSLMRRISSILLRDVMSSRNSRVLQEFAPLLANGVGAEIKEAFLRKESQPDDNISMTHDQIENLASHIRAGLHYPSITIGCMAKYEDIVAFLNELCDIFKWEKYESGTLGYAKVTDTGIVHSKLRWYAFILNKWISGISLKQMITETMHTPEFPFAECKTQYTCMLRKRGFFFALYKRQKTKKPSESLATKTF